MEFPETLLPLVESTLSEKINIISKKVNYSINKSLAVVISPYFSHAISANPMIKEIYLPIDEDIDQFFKGKNVDPLLFLEMSILLNNKKLIQKWKKENPVGELAFIEQTIEMTKIPSEYLSEIFKNWKAKRLKSEKEIKQYIIQKLQEEKDIDKRKKLIESIEIRGLSNHDMKDLIENLKYEDLSQQLFTLIKDHNQMENFEKEYQQDPQYQNHIDGFSQLHFAAKKNYIGIGEYLISKGANIESKDFFQKNMKFFYSINIF